MKVTANLAFFSLRFCCWASSVTSPAKLLFFLRHVLSFLQPIQAQLCCEMCGVGAPRLTRQTWTTERREVIGHRRGVKNAFIQEELRLLLVTAGETLSARSTPPRPRCTYSFFSLKMHTLLRSVGRANRGGSLLEAVVFFFYFCFTLAKGVQLSDAL